MASTGSGSLARELLARAAARDGTKEDERLERNLLVAAAIREVLDRDTIVVGGTAEDFWTADAYHETDLDLVTWSLSPVEEQRLRALGFSREGRHWYHEASGVPVEIAESRLRGDLARVHREPTPPGLAQIIGAEDLYLDRVRQSTVDADDDELQTFRSALAIAAANFFEMDWVYVDAAIEGETEVAPALMRKIDRRVRRRVRRRLAEGGSSR